MCACIANGIVTCQQQCRPIHSHREPGIGQLRSTNEDCVPTAAIYRQTIINDNVLWTVIHEWMSNPLSRVTGFPYMKQANCETVLILYSIVTYNWLGLLTLQSLSLFTSEALTIQHDCCSLSGNAEFAGVDNAGVDKSAPCCRDGNCRSGQVSTMWQSWTLQEWAKACENVLKTARIHRCSSWTPWITTWTSTPQRGMTIFEETPMKTTAQTRMKHKRPIRHRHRMLRSNIWTLNPQQGHPTTAAKCVWSTVKILVVV